MAGTADRAPTLANICGALRISAIRKDAGLVALECSSAPPLAIRRQLRLHRRKLTFTPFLP